MLDSPLIASNARRQMLRRVALLALGAATARAAGVPSYELRVLVSDANDSTQEILKAMAARFPGLRFGEDLKELTARKGNAVYVATSGAALKAIIELDASLPTLSLFVANEAYTRLTSALRNERGQSRITALFAEASPQHQLRLVRNLYNRRITVAVLLSSATAHLRPQMEHAARANDLDLEMQLVDEGANVLRALTSMRSAKALLTLPDPSLYTPQTFRYVLESAYRRQQGVIGFSSELVRAGALGASYSTIADVIAQVPQFADELSLGRTPAPQYPAYWRVEINDRVAQSLDLIVDDGLKNLGALPATR